MRKSTADDRPPGPRGRWLVGNTYDYDLDRIGFLHKCQEQYGDVFSFSPRTIFVGDPELINELFSRTNEDFLFDEPVFASEADNRHLVDIIGGWMQGRRMIWRGLTKAAIRGQGEHVVAELTRTLGEQNGHDFDVRAVMRDSSVRLAADFMFGPGSEDVVAATHERSELTLMFMGSNLTLPKWLPLPGVQRANRARSILDEVVTARLRARRAAPHEAPEDLLDLVLATEGDTAPTEVELVALLTSMMLASYGSPGSSLAWMILGLIRHPQVRDRIREETLAAIAETGSILDDRKLPYSRAYISEVLRLYPPTWIVGRTVHRRCKLGPWTLEPGQSVRFSPYLVQRDPRWWDEPDQLRPERWLDGAKAMTPHTYVPFGAGPRNCIGMHLSAYQLVTAASLLATHYTMEATNLPGDEPDTETILLPLGLRARITPIDPATAAPLSPPVAEV